MTTTETPALDVAALDRLDALAQAATQATRSGTWDNETMAYSLDSTRVITIGAGFEIFAVTPDANADSEAVAAYIAACSPDVIRALVAALRAAQADAARLDWLEERLSVKPGVAVCFAALPSGAVVADVPAVKLLGSSADESIRAAIDAAMKADAARTPAPTAEPTP